LALAVSAPIARAAVFIANRRGREAIEVLRPAAPYDSGRTAALGTIYLRAEAERASGDAAAAAAEYQRLLEHRGSEPFALVHAAGSPGRARAEATLGRLAAARESYALFLKAFERADADVPLVAQARAEAAAVDAQAR